MNVIKFSGLMMSLLLAASATGLAAECQKGGKAQVEWKGKWYLSTIKDIVDGKYCIHYDGWVDSWDECVDASRIKCGAQGPQIGNKGEVSWKGKYYPATVKQVKGDKYFIHYDGWADSWDEWITIERWRTL